MIHLFVSCVQGTETLTFSFDLCPGVEDILVKPGANKRRKKIIKESLKIGTKVSKANVVFTEQPASMNARSTFDTTESLNCSFVKFSASSFLDATGQNGCHSKGVVHGPHGAGKWPVGINMYYTQ